MNKTQKVLEALKAGEEVTNVTMYNKCGTTRLGAIIGSLRNRYEISTIMCEEKDRYGNKTRFARYKLIGDLKS